MKNVYDTLSLPTLTVEVFKTNVQTIKEAQVIAADLQGYFPGHCINFDLEDCDRILRLEGKSVNVERVLSVLLNYGLECSVLEG
jgi:hypothetical protein